MEKPEILWIHLNSSRSGGLIPRTNILQILCSFRAFSGIWMHWLVSRLFRKRIFQPRMIRLMQKIWIRQFLIRMLKWIRVNRLLQFMWIRTPGIRGTGIFMDTGTDIHSFMLDFYCHQDHG